jgi:hypothetical protein
MFFENIQVNHVAAEKTIASRMGQMEFQVKRGIVSILFEIIFFFI